MKALRLSRYALSVSVVAVLLSACGGGGSSPLAPVPGAVENSALPLLKSKTFHFGGSEQTFKVPDGVKSVTLVVRGAQGGGAKGGRGGRVYAVIPVFSREKLYVFVGGRGLDQHGGFNGGGEGGNLYGFGYGGGGASDVRAGGKDISDRVVVAGGGGGEGEVASAKDAPRAYFYAASGGKGGASTGGTGEIGWPGSYSGYFPGGGGGTGASQVRGGPGGYGGEGALGFGMPGERGDFGKGGAGGAGCGTSSCFTSGEDGGGGGGGYYGGGGGGAGGASSNYLFGGGGGGGGSSYIEPKATKFQSWQGWKHAIGDGLIVISWK